MKISVSNYRYFLWPHRYILLSLLLLVAQTATATLILIIPTNDGLVVAADSRTTVQGQHFDSIKKLEFVAGEPSLVFTFTGTAQFASEVPKGRSLESWVKSGEKEFDANLVVRDFLTTSGTRGVSVDTLNQLSEVTAKALAQYFLKRPGAAEPYLNQQLCRFIIAKFDAKSRLSSIGTFVLSVAADRRISSSKLELSHFSPLDRVFVGRYGESEYVDRNVISGPGRKFIPQAVSALWGANRRIKHMTAAEAALISETIVRATENTAIYLPAGASVGGKTNIYLVDGVHPAIKLKGKW